MSKRMIAALMVAVLLVVGCASEPVQQEQVEEEPAELVRKTLAEYSWDELSQISQEICNASTPEEQREVAKTYGIVEQDGSLTTQTKQITLDGDDTRIWDVRVVGICHDDRADGSGKAGLTFMTVGGIAILPMNDEARVEGGWEASDLRAELDSEQKARLERNLRKVLVGVEKLTNNTGLTDSMESVTATADELWVPSVHEVCGDVTWDIEEFRGVRGSEDVDGIVNAEGEQYEAFVQAGVTGETDPQGMLDLSSSTGTSSWWYRTPYPFEFQGYGDTGSNGYFYQVSASGFPQSLGSPEVPTTVVVGFCI